MKLAIVLAARTGSKRFPGKVLMPLMGLPVVVFILKRLEKSKYNPLIILATTNLEEDDILAQTVQKEGYRVFRGSSEDVLDRYAKAIEFEDIDYLIRVTGDCPFIGADSLDYVIKKVGEDDGFDLLTTKPAFPSGVDYEVCRKETFLEINKLKLPREEREHIMNRFYNNPDLYRIKKIVPPNEMVCPDYKFLLDTPKDFKKIDALLSNFNTVYFNVSNIIEFVKNEN